LPARAADGDAAKAPAVDEASGKEQSERDLGIKVLAVQKAIRNPKAPGAMDAITALGRDSRYYVMVRGWLVQELAGAESIRDANRKEIAAELRERIDFLHKAIRAIDLEK
jgi:hypothetical protein